MTEPVLESLLTCPACGHAKILTMSTDACQWFYERPKCKTLLKQKPGDCCVFCSYGSFPCPSIQQARATGKVGCCGEVQAELVLWNSVELSRLENFTPLNCLPVS